MSVVDSYSTSNYAGAGNEYFMSGGIDGLGQSFTGNGLTLTDIQAYLKKAGSPSGDMTAKIYAHSGTFGTSSVPTGSALAVSAPIDASTLTTTITLTTFTFSGGNQIDLTNATNYVLTIEGSFPGGVNNPGWGADFTSPTHGGNTSYLISGSWTADSYTDLIFYVNGTTPPSGHPAMRRWGGTPGMGQGQSFGRSW